MFFEGFETDDLFICENGEIISGVYGLIYLENGINYRKVRIVSEQLDEIFIFEEHRGENVKLVEHNTFFKNISIIRSLI
jgi:hypothetical protein